MAGIIFKLKMLSFFYIFYSQSIWNNVLTFNLVSCTFGGGSLHGVVAN